MCPGVGLEGWVAWGVCPPLCWAVCRDMDSTLLLLPAFQKGRLAATKRNDTELVQVMWMDRESVTQSEGSQKENTNLAY